MDSSVPIITDGPIPSLDKPGVPATDQVLRLMRSEVARLLNRRQESFPGAQPVSFAREHLGELLKEDYYVCEKSDGIRYLMYLTEDEEKRECHYLIDRKNQYWYIANKNLHFPRPESRTLFHTETLVDGELVMDTMSNGRTVPRFLVFDCLVIDGKSLMDRSLDKRLAYFNENIYRPYGKLFQEFPDELKYQPFEVEMKAMQFSYAMELMFKEVLPKLRHGNDGLIFTCRNSAYRHGTDPHILKWKPPEENTIDCRLRLVFPEVARDEHEMDDGESEPLYNYGVKPQCELWTFSNDSPTNKYRYYQTAYVTDEEWEILKSLGDPLDDRVVECYQDASGKWRISRFRDDKPEANHISTLHSVLKSIEDRVTQEDLIDSAKAIRVAWKKRTEVKP